MLGIDDQNKIDFSLRNDIMDNIKNIIWTHVRDEDPTIIKYDDVALVVNKILVYENIPMLMAKLANMFMMLGSCAMSVYTYRRLTLL